MWARNWKTTKTASGLGAIALRNAIKSKRFDASQRADVWWIQNRERKKGTEIMIQELNVCSPVASISHSSCISRSLACKRVGNTWGPYKAQDVHYAAHIEVVHTLYKAQRATHGLICRQDQRDRRLFPARVAKKRRQPRMYKILTRMWEETQWLPYQAQCWGKTDLKDFSIKSKGPRSFFSLGNC